jgi:hypothetical protein
MLGSVVRPWEVSALLAHRRGISEAVVRVCCGGQWCSQCSNILCYCQTLPVSRTVIILKFKTMKKSRGFASFVERAAVHGASRALYWDTDWHLSCSQNINMHATATLTKTQQPEPYVTKYMALGLLWAVTTKGVKRIPRFSVSLKNPIATSFNPYYMALYFCPKSFSILFSRNYIPVTPNGLFHWGLPAKFPHAFYITRLLVKDLFFLRCGSTSSENRIPTFRSNQVSLFSMTDTSRLHVEHHDLWQRWWNFTEMSGFVYPLIERHIPV